MRLDLELVGEFLVRLGRKLSQVPFAFFVVIVLAAALLKATFIWTPWVFVVSEVFPEPKLEKSNQFTGIALARLVNESSWAYFALTAIAILVAVIFVWRAGDTNSITSSSSRTRLILAFSWPLVLSGLAWYGFGTELMPLFVAFVIFARQRWLWLVGVVGASLTHPELSLISFGGLWLLGWSPEFRKFRTRGLVGMLWSLVVVILTSLWLFLAGAQPRGELVIEVLPFSIRSQLRHSVLGLYSAWSVWWIIVLLAFLLVGRRAKQMLLISAVIGPSLVTMVSLDATRDFTGAAAAAGLAIFWLVTSRLEPDSDVESPATTQRRQQGMLGLVFVAFLLLPNVQFKTVLDPVPEPGRLWVDLLEIYILPALDSMGM